MNRKYWILFGVLAAIYIVYHFATLVYSPFPWFDEVCFSGLTESYMNHGTYYEEARIVAEPKEKLNYGPIYFVWQSIIMKSFGIGIFSFRITNFLFGLFSLYLIYRICRQLKFSAKATVVTLMFVALEPNFNQFLHSGRMDFISVFFFLLSFLTFCRINFERKYIAAAYALVTGVLITCAMLTTPRIVFAFPVYVFFFLYEFIRDERRNRTMTIVKYGLIALGFAAVFYLWIVVTFGGAGGYIYNITHASYMKDHIGVGVVKAIKYNLFIYIYAFVCFIILILNRKLVANKDLVLLTIPAIAVFIVIVTGGLSGRYFAMVLPFTALIISGTTIDIVTGKFLRFATYGIIGLFGIVFVFKSVYILSTIPQRDPYANEKIISRYLTPNSSVVGDFQFYYIARHNNCSFLSIESNGSFEDKFGYFVNNKIEYVIIGKNNVMRPFYEQAFINDNYELIAFVEDKNYSSFFASIVKRLPYRISDSYSCYIYRHKSKIGAAVQ